MDEITVVEEELYAHECRIRDLYASRLREFRPDERLLQTEHTYEESKVRGDMRTIDRVDTIRIWEFKINAGYEGLGQILTYLALARKDLAFKRQVRGVLAAFHIQPEVALAIEVLNLGIEVVMLPEKMRLAGAIPRVREPLLLPQIPELSALLPPRAKDE
ncbi:hypothetical protein [Micromonospora cathayae]|uniref:Uncharacterized protein n=1 Tax=Micromonospora cathayae TaxID=3028804 RepID=A0ABY7ZP36_9ACTN|nr:hypothetical protein [Micromonospora sp. HUAS 3]WDZ84715.1 hypothetical protein PVK37_30540 [Micromonospora sp. HUAS 3]